MRILIFISAAVLTSAGAFAQVGFNTRQYDTGAVGITAGQTARLTVLYPTVPAPVLQVLCSATLVIEDDQANTVKDVTVSQLVAGKSASLSLNADTDLPAGSGPTQIHARVLTPAPAGGGGGGCTLVPTLELVDNLSGKTTVVLKGEITYPFAQATPVFEPLTGRR